MYKEVTCSHRLQRQGNSYTIMLKSAIIDWLLDHENEWQRVNACHEAFRPYIYDQNGNYLIGGKTVSEFIGAANRLLYGKEG